MKFLFLLMFFFIIPTLIFSQKIGDFEMIGSSVEGYTSVRKDNCWGFINSKGELVVNFRDDLIYNKKPSNSRDLGVASQEFPSLIEERGIIKKIVNGISLYGFIDSAGLTVIEPQFLNVSNYKYGYALAIIVEEKLLGGDDMLEVQNVLNYNVVLINKTGEIVSCLEGPFQEMDSKGIFKETPLLEAKWISENLIALKSPSNKWEIFKI